MQKRGKDECENKIRPTENFVRGNRGKKRWEKWNRKMEGKRI